MIWVRLWLSSLQIWYSYAKPPLRSSAWKFARYLKTGGKIFRMINNSAAKCPIVLKFQFSVNVLWPTGNCEKNTSGQVQDGSRPQVFNL